MLREQLIHRIYRVLAVVTVVAVLGGGYSAYLTGDMWLIPVYLVSYGLILLFAFWSRVPYRLQAGLLIFMIYLVGLLDFFQDGRGGSGRLFLLAVPLIAALLFGRREGWFGLVLVLITLGVLAVAFSTGMVSIPPENEVHSTNLVGWLTNTAVVLLIGTLLLSAINYLFPRLGIALDQSRALAREVEERRASLESQISERSRELARRTGYLGAATAVAREAQSAQGDLTRLLPRIVNAIGEQFGFYHIGLFMRDESGEWMVLQAASSEGGRRMLEHGHRLRVGAEGIVGYVAARGIERIVLDVGEDAVFFDNPDLPDTHSEMAAPLRVRGEVVGVLDVQSTESQAFAKEDVDVLQTLSDQIAMAIGNAQLLQQVEASLETERRALGQQTREAWQRLLQAQRALGFYDDGREIVPAGDLWRPEMEAALNDGVQALNDDGTTLAIPIRVRDQVVGVIDGRKADGSAWTTAEIDLLMAITDQLNVALEGAQLYRDAQRREARERLIGQVGGRVRETLDLETMLRTAAEQMRQALDLEDLVVRLAAPEENESI
ncbi:MAG: GAF domain-containing protein [Anaerolineae bacterium]|nr:GAF domain-containing protein [Anaerolineae bacterium]